jgi:hypothetical protein
MRVNRREFIVASGAVAVTALSPLPASTAPTKANAQRIIFRLSVRGRRTSRAAKAFCANMRFKTKHVAQTYPLPHPGINARVVPVPVSINEFHRLFIGGHTHIADLRQLRGLKVIGARGTPTTISAGERLKK